MTKKITQKTFPKYKGGNPIFQGLPESLKDPANYEKVQRALLETLASSHSHGEILEWYNCAPCSKKMEHHRYMMTKLGFQSPAQYMAWKKTMEAIKKRIPFPKYNSK